MPTRHSRTSLGNTHRIPRTYKTRRQARFVVLHFVYMRASRGFTLIELLTVIAITGLLSSVIFASLNSSRDKSRMAAGEQLDATFQRSLGDQRIGAWKFDDCSGTTLQNLESFSYIANLIGGATWSTDTPYGRGCSLLFDGSTGYAKLDNAGGSIYSVQPGTVRTFTAWFKSTTPTETQQTIISKINCVGWSVAITANATVYGQFDPAPCGSPARVTSTGTYVDSKWHFVALTVDRINNILSLYIDGAIIGTDVVDAGASSFGNFLVGNDTAGEYFNGLVDEVYAYSISLSLSQVQKLYAEGLASHPLAGVGAAP